MNDKPQQSTQSSLDVAALRRRAEAHTQLMESPVPSVQTPEEIQRMLHELQVQQIELEMQNEELRTAQGVIEAVRARYFDLYNLAPVGYCTVSEKGLILEANLTAATLLGTTCRALLKQPISHLMFKEDQNIYYRQRNQLRATGEAQECEVRLIKRDGTLFWVHMTEIAAQADDGAPVYRIAFNDISARKQAEDARSKSERFLRFTVDGLSAHITVLDEHGEIILTNKAYRDFAEQTDLEPCIVSEGVNYLAFCDAASGEHAEEAKPFAEGLRKVLSGEHPYFELEYPCHSPDEKRWFVARVTRFHGKGPRCVIVAHENITQRKQAEALAIAAMDRAEAATRAKSIFLANMSHELRTPMNGILGLAQIGWRDNETNASGPLFRRIQQAGQHLLAVLNDILDFSRIEAGKLPIDPVPFRLSNCIAELQSMFGPQVTTKGLELRIERAPEGPDWVLGDVLRVRQILLNLLGNAVKFTARGAVSLTVERAGGERLRFIIADTGPGMTEEQIARIFKPFEQADASTTRAHGGSGLGLAISSQLVQLMGGTLEVDSEPGQGSRFTLCLPLPDVQPPPSAAAERTTGASGPRLSGWRILAVDDVEINLLILENVLRREGAKVTTATNGEEAIACVVRQSEPPFDLVLMDVQMPVMDGYEATRRIRCIAPLLPVIGLTAHALASTRTQCLEAGMVAHLTKPLVINVVVEEILRWKPQGGPRRIGNGQG